MSFSAEAIEKGLETQLIGKSVIVYEKVGSTNDVLKRVSGQEGYDGLAVFAKYQSKGRGRNGRVWQGMYNKSILCSVLVFFKERAETIFGRVLLASAVATARAIRRIFSIDVRIKWPNDIYYCNRKLGGILIESSSLGPRKSQDVSDKHSAFIVGIGINCRQRNDEFSEDIREMACSISEILARSVSEDEMIELARELLRQLDSYLMRISKGEGDCRWLRDEWLEFAGNSDDSISVNYGSRQFAARIVDIDVSDGSLLVQDYDGVIIHLKQNEAKIL